MKKSLLYEGFNPPTKLNDKEFPPYEAFHNKLRRCNLLGKEYLDYEEKLIGSGLTTEYALVKMRFSEKPPTEAEKYSCLKKVWEEEKLQSFKDFLRWYNNKDVVPALEGMQKMVEFYHNKGIYMLKFGCTLHNLANIRLHTSTSAKFCRSTESNEDLHSKVCADMGGGPSIVFTRKAVVGETHIRKSTNVCKSIVGKDALQLYCNSMCQPMPTRLQIWYEFHADMQKFKPRQNKSRNFEKRVMSYHQLMIWDCRIGNFSTTRIQKKY